MSENLKYWLWLQKALGEGAAIKRIVHSFGGARQLYEANVLEWRMSPDLTVSQVDRLSAVSLNDTEEIIYQCEKKF